MSLLPSGSVHWTWIPLNIFPICAPCYQPSISLGFTCKTVAWIYYKTAPKRPTIVHMYDPQGWRGTLAILLVHEISGEDILVLPMRRHVTTLYWTLAAGLISLQLGFIDFQCWRCLHCQISAILFKQCEVIYVCSFILGHGTQHDESRNHRSWFLYSFFQCQRLPSWPEVLIEVRPWMKHKEEQKKYRKRKKKEMEELLLLEKRWKGIFRKDIRSRTLKGISVEKEPQRPTHRLVSALQ